ncbi:Hypothetical protein CINCED_3A020586 [Cinara cedri]|uniref:Uncharacterized protein n=1 Tax=Cinara cedri TaxID=506608 RepID=A0A5E4LZK3_9HEMI|nr:Hypothetical protein CINCED_3A020586 [Cinara cedri]
MAEGSNSNQFQFMPQVVPIFRPQQLPPPPPPPLQNAHFRMPGQPIFPVPPHFGYPPVTWSPIHQYPISQPIYNPFEEDNDYNHEYYNNNGHNGCPIDNMQNRQQSPRRSIRTTYTRNVSSKFDTRHEEFRKHLEETGILSSFTNILAEMYQDPLRPNDSLGYIRDKLACSKPEVAELSNLRQWCEQYQIKTMRLEKELKHVIERLRKHEPYITDDSLFENSAENDCKSCVLDTEKQELKFWNKEENANHKSIKDNNQ